MEQRDEETTVEFARRLVDAGEPTESVELSVSLSASTILSVVKGMPEGTTPQDAIRARILMTNIQDDVWDLSAGAVSAELDEIEDQLENLVGVVAVEAICADYDADVSLTDSDSESDTG